MNFRRATTGFGVVFGLLYSASAHADDSSLLQSARDSIGAEQYEDALRSLRKISDCETVCKYLRAIVSSKFRDRGTTLRLTNSLLDDPEATMLIKKGAEQLKTWATDTRIGQPTGKRIVRRATRVGFTLSGPDECTLDLALTAHWQQQWDDLGVDPDEIYVPEQLKPCNLGSPIVSEETYSERCEAYSRRRVEGYFGNGWGYSGDFGNEEGEDSGYLSIEEIEAERTTGLGAALFGDVSSITLDGGAMEFECSEFNPPEVEFEDGNADPPRMSDLLNDLHQQALRIANALRERGEKVAVADGATGGLIAASLLTVPGALEFYVGGGIVYSLRARDVLFDLPREAYKGMRGASEEYALLQARAIRDNFGAEWGLAESGSVGGSSHPSGAPAGRSVAAVVGPDGFERTAIIETQSDERIENMGAFTRNAIGLLEAALQR